MSDPIGGDVDDRTDDEEEAGQRRSRGPVLAALAVLVVVAGLVVTLATRAPATDRIGSTPLLGNPAPALTGRTIRGDQFDLTDERGRWVVVNFFATWCAPCIQEHPDLMAWEERNRTTGEGTLVTVVFDDNVRNVIDFFEEQGGGTWPVLDGDGGSVGLDWGVIKVPESYVVDPSGIVRAKILGGVTLDGLEQIIADLEAGG